MANSLRMRSRIEHTRLYGITLAELLVALAVLCIVVSMAVSGFSTFSARRMLDNQVSHLVHHLHMARQQSRLFDSDVAVCRSSTGKQCNTTRGWHEGYLVFVNHDGDEPPAVDPGERILAASSTPAALTMTANRPAFVMRPRGLRATNGTFVICDRLGRAAARKVTVSYTGKPRSGRAADTRSGACE